MKRFNLLPVAVIAALSLAACQQNEITESMDLNGSAIGFSTNLLGAGPTRGTSIAAGDIGTAIGKKPAVLAYHTESDWANTATPNFMYNTELTNSASSWTYSPIKFWPNTGKVSFFAYAPHDGTGMSLSSKTATGTPKITFTVQSDPSSQIDLLLAAPVMNNTKVAHSASAVTLSFKHALAKIVFKAQTANDYSGGGTTVTLQSIKIGKLTAGSAKNAFRTVETVEMDNASPNWTDTSGSFQGFTLESGDLQNKTLTSSYQQVTAVGEELFVIPQNFSTGEDVGLPIEVQYQVSTLDGGSPIITTNTATGIITPNLLAGKAYIVQLNVSLSEITFACSLTPWEDGSIPAITLN